MTTTAKPRRWLAAMCGLVLLSTACLAAAQGQRTSLTAPVTRVLDGDTIEVNLGDRLEIVRYIGIGTPEIPHPTRGTDYREAARRANARLVAGKTVRLVLDSQPRDRAGRLLAYVHAGASFVNAELVAAGFAEVATAPPNVRHRELFVTRQREARLAMRGLWADPEVAKYHRPRPAGVSASTRLKIYFHPDDDSRNILLADHFVHFESPQQAAAAGYRPSMDYAAYARKEHRVLSGAPLPVTYGAPVGGAVPGSPGASASSGASPKHGTEGAPPPKPYLGGDMREGAAYSPYPKR